MIAYEPGKWSVCFALSLTGSVIPKASVWACSCSMLSSAIHMGFRIAGIDADNWFNSRCLTVFGGFTFILGFLVVFRSQQAYNRWWEGGTLLQQLRGEWFNAFSSLMAFCNPSKEKETEVEKFKHRLVRLTSLLYSSALLQVTTIEHPTFEVIELDGFDLESLEFLDEAHDRCEVVLQWIQRLIVEAHAEDILKIAPPILSRVYNQLGNGIVNLSNARKITDFPIPFPLAQMLSLMLITQWLAIAIICAAILPHVSVVAFISFMAQIAYWSINYIAVELEMPFGDDPNDLPLHQMQKDLNASLRALLNKKALSYPRFQMQTHTENLTLIELDFHSYVQTDRRANMHYDKSGKNRRSRRTRPVSTFSRMSTMTVNPSTSASEEVRSASVERQTEVCVIGKEQQVPTVACHDVNPAVESPTLSDPVPPPNVHIGSSGGADKRHADSEPHRIDSSARRVNFLNPESTLGVVGGMEDSADRQLNRELVRVNHTMEGYLAQVVQTLTALYSILAQAGEIDAEASQYGQLQCAQTKQSSPGSWCASIPLKKLRV